MNKVAVIFLGMMGLSGLRAETSYSVADTLIVRQFASRSSAIISLIPYGTRVDHTQHEVDAEGYHWTWVHSMGGYVAREFLSKKPPTKGLKVLSLRSSSSYVECNSEGYSGWDELQLSSGEFSYRGGGDSVNISVRTIASGTYELADGGIRLQFRSIGWFSAFPGKSLPTGDPPTHSTNFTRILTYNRALSGFTVDGGPDPATPEFFLTVLKTASSTTGSLIDIAKCQVRTAGCSMEVNGYLCSR